MKKQLITALASSILLDLLLLSMVIFLLPIRTAVLLLARIFKPNLTSFVTGIAQIFRRPLVNDRLPSVDCLAFISVEGNFEIEMVREFFNLRVLQYQNSDGKYVYRRFRETTTDFLGYSFWTEDSNFDLCRHIQNCTDTSIQITDENSLRKNMSKLHDLSWDKRRSPWEIILFRGYNKSETLVMIRWHHLLADGISIAKLMNLMFTSEGASMTKKPYSGSSEIVKQLTNIVRIPFDTAVAITKGKKVEPSSVLVPRSEISGDDMDFTKPFLVEDIKRAADKFKVSFQTILFSAFTSAVEKSLKDLNLPVPVQEYCHVALRTSKHPDELTNDFLPGHLPLPIKCPSMTERLRKTEDNFQEITSSTFSLGQYYRVKLTGYFPNALRNYCFGMFLQPGLLYFSSLPYFGKMKIMGKNITEMFAQPAGIQTATDFGVFTTGMPNQIRFGIVLKKSYPVNISVVRAYVEKEMEWMAFESKNSV